MAHDYRAELKWLKANPDFHERPATLLEFLGPDYMNIESGVRDAIKECLKDIFGADVSSQHIAQVTKAIITGGIGIGKTTIASIVLPYLAHWCLCLKDPQNFFGLLPGSRIAFMMMSTSEDQAKEVLFGDIIARIKHSPWFRDNYQMDPTFKNQIRFPKDIWILPGDSNDTTFEGYNILGGIIDEIDSHKVTERKDYAEDGYNTIFGRLSSRFGRVKRGKNEYNYGFLLLIGQMKKSNGFASRMYEEYKIDADCYAVRMTIWESLGWHRFLKDDGSRDSFWYDIKRKQIVPSGIASAIATSNVIEIPNAYLKDFRNKPEKALKDLAGIPPAVGDPFISLTYKVDDARDRWKARYPSVPEGPVRLDNTFAKWFKAPDTLKRVVHIDMAYSAEGDALGLAMGHVREVVDIDGERKPYIVFDLLYRVKAPSGSEIFLGDIRRIIYSLRDDLGFKIKRVTYDGFQSQDSVQQLRRRRFETDVVSVDKQVLPYHDLREALYEDRIEFPPYLTYINHGDDKQVEIAVKELTELEDTGKKIDHPTPGSKDVTDAMAGVTYTLMGDRSYSRRVVSINTGTQRGAATGTDGSSFSSMNGHPALGGLTGIGAPVPPTTTTLRGLPR